MVGAKAHTEGEPALNELEPMREVVSHVPQEKVVGFGLWRIPRASPHEEGPVENFMLCLDST